MTPDPQRVADLHPASRGADLLVRVHALGPARDLPARDGSPGPRIAEAVVGDASATVVLTLWNREVDAVREGDVLRIAGAYAKLHRGQIRISVGRDGSVQAVDEWLEADPGATNISEAVHEEPAGFTGARGPPRGGQGFGGPRRGGFGDGPRRGGFGDGPRGGPGRDGGGRDGSRGFGGRDGSSRGYGGRDGSSRAYGGRDGSSRGYGGRDGPSRGGNDPGSGRGSGRYGGRN